MQTLHVNEPLQSINWYGHIPFRACLHQASSHWWDDASDTVLIENNGVAPEWGCNPFSSNSIVFNENSITSLIAEFSQRWHWRCMPPQIKPRMPPPNRCKWALTAKTLANSNRLYNHSVQNWTLVKLFCMYSVDSQKVFSSGTTICASWTRPSEQQTWKSRCTF